MQGFNEENFYMGTEAVWEECECPEGSPDYESYSGSDYWYEGPWVYRRSDHWGHGVSTCNWYLNEDDGRSSFNWGGGTRCGRCRFSNFEFSYPDMMQVTVYGVPKEEADGVDFTGTGYFVIDVVPEMMSDGDVHTAFGDCRFDVSNGMYIDL